MKPINRIIYELSQPWPQYEKTKDEGKKGQNKYIPWTGCRRILDECAPGWHSEIKEISEVAGRIVAIVRIYIVAEEGVAYREGAAWVQIPADGKAMYGDPVKNSTSNAFKRAAYQFGIGEYLRGRNQAFGQPEGRRSNTSDAPASIAEIRKEYERLGWKMGQDRAFETEELQLAEWAPEMLKLATEAQRQAMLIKLREMEKPVNLSKSTFWETVLGAQISTEVGNRIVAYRTGEAGTTDWIKAMADLRQCIDFKRACFEARLDSAAVATVLKQNGGNYKQATDAVKRDFLNRAA